MAHSACSIRSTIGSKNCPSLARNSANNTNILTEGLAYNLIEFEQIRAFRPLPGGAFPALDGVLVGAVPDAGSGGRNELINPIDGQPILFDVFGNPRTRGGTRDIGAVQAVPEPSSLAIFGLLGVVVVGFCLVRQRKLNSGQVH